MHPATSGWPEIVFSGEVFSRPAISQAVREGRARRLGPGIYTSIRLGPLEDVVRRNWVQIVDHELPGAIITDRSVRHSGPDDGVLTVVHSRKRPLELPGLTVLPRPGAPVLPGDTPMSGLWLASQPRALLENLHGTSRHTRYLSRGDIEQWIADLLLSQGERHLNFVRDEARKLANQGRWSREFVKLTSIIGAALATHPGSAVQTDVLRARADGAAYDHRRMELFEGLASALLDEAPDPLPLLAIDNDRRRLLPFYEAYFSNYIEGTEFTLDEAASIVFDQEVPRDRPEDAHDILGTYQLVIDPSDRARIPESADDLVALLIERHRRLMGARADKNPGVFKKRSNQAGSTVFVAPDLVEDTLRRGFEVGGRLIDPFARAVYMGFLVGEVHPFDDGNGRISRIFSNAELTRGGEGRIIIPTVFRNNYIASLKGATHNAHFAALVATLRFAQRYTARIDFSSRQSAEADLMRTNALRDPTEADDVGIRLQMP